MNGSPLEILPLGGSGEVGLNATRYRVGQDCIVVDFGALLGIEDLPSVSRLVPSVEGLDGLDVHGLLLTHGHEDHIGGVGHLLERRNIPVYGLPLPIEMVKSRLRSNGGGSLVSKGTFVSLEPGESIELGPFTVELVAVTHSIPDTAMVVIRAGGTTVVHTGDFKLDTDPVWGGASDADRLRALGRQGVDLLMSDSTNAEREGRTPTERSVCDALKAWMEGVPGRAVITFVSSHLHRMRGLVQAASEVGRQVVVAGRSMERNLELAEGLGLFPPLPRVSWEQAANLPPERLLVLATGSQGEPGGALSRLARSELAPLSLSPGDGVAFSARVIPGREVQVRTLRNRLVQRGVAVATARDLPIHTSGHAQQAEQIELIQWLRPRNFAPMHGDRTMLEAHARTARAAGMSPETIWMVEDGQSLRLHPGGRMERGPDHDLARVPLDEAGHPLSWGEAKSRRRLAQRGLVVAMVAVDSYGKPQGPVGLEGFGVEFPERARDRTMQAAREALDDPSLISLDMMEERLRNTIRRQLGLNRHGPWLEVRVLRGP